MVIYMFYLISWLYGKLFPHPKPVGGIPEEYTPLQILPDFDPILIKNLIKKEEIWDKIYGYIQENFLQLYST